MYLKELAVNMDCLAPASYRLARWGLFPAMVGNFLFPMSTPTLGQASYQVVMVITFSRGAVAGTSVLRLTYMSLCCGT
jgi:hypothetical protein